MAMLNNQRVNYIIHKLDQLMTNTNASAGVGVTVNPIPASFVVIKMWS
jgi:hypothetical protein